MVHGRRIMGRGGRSNSKLCFASMMTRKREMQAASQQTCSPFKMYEYTHAGRGPSPKERTPWTHEQANNTTANTARSIRRHHHSSRGTPCRPTLDRSFPGHMKTAERSCFGQSRSKTREREAKPPRTNHTRCRKTWGGATIKKRGSCLGHAQIRTHNKNSTKTICTKKSRKNIPTTDLHHAVVSRVDKFGLQNPSNRSSSGGFGRLRSNDILENRKAQNSKTRGTMMRVEQTNSTVARPPSRLMS